MNTNSCWFKKLRITFFICLLLTNVSSGLTTLEIPKLWTLRVNTSVYTKSGLK